MLLQNLRSLGLTYQQIRCIFSKTGKWRKKINKTTLMEVESHWKEKVLSPHNPTLTQACGQVADSNKKYILSMFPYPSGDLHMGHMRVYTISDVLARYHRLNGKHVIHPIGWDAFGLPAENAAIDRKLAPRAWTESNIERMRTQLKDLRISFDWDREISTCNSDYYRWTQWIFLQMYKKGLAYSMKEAVNWDPVDETVLADEQIDSEGNSWRSGAQVEKRYLTQWYLRATNYTQSLLDGLDTLDPDHCQGFSRAQRTWLGETTGVKITVSLQPGNDVLSVFTETPELLCGVEFLQLSPNHPIANQHNVRSGLVPNVSIINPLTSEPIPILVQEHESFTEKNRCRFGISALIEADAATASQFGLELRPTVLDSQSKLQNSTDDLNGLEIMSARKKVNQHLKDNKLGGYPTNSQLKDWLISRQRYWGTPIPIIHCSDRCGAVPVPEEDLPVVLPEVTELSGRGGNPLAAQEDWVNTTCPKCGGPARRETDTMDTFVDSSWYYLRYTDPNNKSRPFSAQLANQMMPVDVYVGGAEHAILHMYFARFLSHFFYDEGMTPQPEPFTLQLALGTVHSDCYRVTETGKYLHRNKIKKQGDDTVIEKGTGSPVTHTVEKMSKSKLNGVNPQSVLDMHGVDQTRLYMLANESPRSTKYWSADLAKKLMFAHGYKISIPHWMHILWHSVSILRQRREALTSDQLIDIDIDTESREVIYNTHNDNICAVSQSLGFPFDLNRAIHKLYTNTYTADEVTFDAKCFSSHYENYFADLLILLHPFIPHMTAELWEGLRTAPRLKTDNTSRHDWNSDIFGQRWPVLDDDYHVRLVIQANVKPDTQHGEEEITPTSDSDTEGESQQEQDSPETSITSQNKTFIKLPYRTVKDLTVEQALNLALESGRIAHKNTETSHSAGNTVPQSQATLAITENYGALLKLSDDYLIPKRMKQDDNEAVTCNS